MRSPWVIGVLLIAVVGAIWYLTADRSGSGDGNVAQNLKNDRWSEQSQAAVVANPGPETKPRIEPDWRELERAGKSPPVPEELFINPSGKGNSWVISPLDREEGVEIPFGIGKFPRSSASGPGTGSRQPRIPGDQSVPGVPPGKNTMTLSTRHTI